MNVLKSFFCFLLVGQAILLNGQAWTKAKGEGFFKADYSFIRSNKLLNNDSKIVDADKIANNVFGIYGEYGLANKITVFGYVPAIVANQNATKNQNFTGIGDIDLGLRIALPVGKIAMSINASIGLPVGTNDRIDFLNTGDGEMNQIVKLAAGSGGTKWWTQASIGFNNRTKNYSDEIRADFEIGYKLLGEKLLAILKINSVKSRDNGTVPINPYGLYSNNVGYVGVGPELLYYLNSSKSAGISGRFAGAFSGRNTQAAPQASIGFFLQVK
jgi:protein XagA